MQGFNIIFFGLGALVGSIVSGITMRFYTPFHGYTFGALVAFAIAIGSVLLSDEIETNEYAQEAIKSTYAGDGFQADSV